jgi:hypothetical protein
MTAAAAVDSEDGSLMTATETSREAQAEQVVKGYLGWSVGAGLIPFPLADLAAIAAVGAAAAPAVAAIVRHVVGSLP